MTYHCAGVAAAADCVRQGGGRRRRARAAGTGLSVDSSTREGSVGGHASANRRQRVPKKKNTCFCQCRRTNTDTLRRCRDYWGASAAAGRAALGVTAATAATCLTGSTATSPRARARSHSVAAPSHPHSHSHRRSYAAHTAATTAVSNGTQVDARVC
jgi:hypothetical protein